MRFLLTLILLALALVALPVLALLFMIPLTRNLILNVARKRFEKNFHQTASDGSSARSFKFGNFQFYSSTNLHRNPNAYPFHEARMKDVTPLQNISIPEKQNIASS